ncbi:MAG: YfhO family protein [Erysipelotrichaceae bacterium]|nr:YfhO family protein [Erysipelotrichaceae bacterium]
MKSIVKKYQNIIYLFLALTMVIVIMFLPYWVKDMPLTYGTDVKTQWFEFFTEFKYLIKNFILNKSLPFYSWSTFLGTNFYAARSYYLIGDIFAYIALLLRTDFFSAYMIQTIMKFYIAGFSFYYLLTVFGYKPIVKIIGSLCYTFSGWAVFYSGQLSFLSFYCFVPLYIAGIEFYLKAHKKLLFVFMTILLLFTNFYFFYTLSFFTPLYYCYRYYQIKSNFRHFIKDTLILIGFYLLGVMVTAVLTLPTILYLLNNNRLNTGSHLLLYPYLKLYFHELVSVLIPNYLYIYKNNIFEIDWHVVREVCLYGGSLTALFAGQVLFNKDARYRRSTLLLYLIMVLIMICPAANSAMHGFADPSLRWLFLFMMVNILVACHYLDRLNELSKRPIIVLAGILASLCLVIVPLTGYITETNFILIDYLPQFMLFAIFAVIYGSYGLLFAVKQHHIERCLLVIMIVELGFSGWYLSKIETDNSAYTWDFIDYATSILESNQGDFNAYLNNLDPNNTDLYYRVYVDLESVYWDFSPNMSQLYQLNGVITYDSTFSPSFNDTAAIADVEYYDSLWEFYIRDAVLLDYLNVKYLVVTDAGQLPVGGDYQLADNYYGLLIYENLNYRPLGTSYSQIITYDTFASRYQNDLSMLNNTLIVHDEDFAAISELLTSSNDASLQSITYGGNQLSGYAESADDSFMVVTLPYDEGWKVEVNGETVRTYQVNGGYIGFPIDAGTNEINMYFVPAGFKAGFIVSAFGGLGFIILAVSEIRKHKGRRTDQK